METYRGIRYQLDNAACRRK